MALSLGAGLCQAQDNATYLYDVHGRLVNTATAVTTGNSNQSNYAYDSADNRAASYSLPVAARAAVNVMSPGEALIPGQAVVSLDGQSRLELRSSGALVIACNGIDQLTLTGPNGTSAFMNMQGDGNLVLYNYAQTPVWYTVTAGHPGAYLVLQDDGNAVVYSGSTPLWWSATSC